MTKWQHVCNFGLVQACMYSEGSMYISGAFTYRIHLV